MNIELNNQERNNGATATQVMMTCIQYEWYDKSIIISEFERC